MHINMDDSDSNDVQWACDIVPAMSRWSQIVQNPDLYIQLQNHYQQCFPIEVRYFLCSWFEDKQWHLLDPDNPAHEAKAAELLKEMLAQLSSKVKELQGDDFLIVRVRLQQSCSEFQNMYQDDAMGFLKMIKSCMEKEAELLRCFQVQSPTDNVAAPTQPTEMDEVRRQLEDTHQQLLAQLQELSIKTQNTEKKYKEMQHKQESFIIQYQQNVKLSSQLQQLRAQMEAIQQQLQAQPNGPDHEKLTAHLQERQAKDKALQAEKKRVDTQLSEQGERILRHRIELAELYKQIIQQLQVVQKQVLDEEMIRWKRRQQLGGNGKPTLKTELDMLQQWCEHLAEVIWSIRQQIKRMGILRTQLPINFPEGVVDLLPELNDVITGMLSSLVTSTFIVEQQPPQVLKKESRFSATVRLLVGGKLSVQMNPPQVMATIISENQAKSLLRSDMSVKEKVSGTILNNTGTMDIQSTSGPYITSSLSVQFRNMQLKKITRSDKKGSEAVTEEKFSILFQSTFNVGGNDLVFQVWTLSLPVVVTVHGNQECNALATVLWDNAFSEPGRIPFVVPESVPWPDLGEQLNLKFQQSTGRGLSQDSLDYLASKIFGGPVEADYSHHMVTWVQFNKDTLKERSFTFWEWFYAVLKLTKEHLKGPWTDGSIIGFISKVKAQECLNQRENGTFLLRFSDSECGGITIAWIAESQTNPAEREVWNLAPYITRDFTIRGLADRIKDLKNLVKLYPDIPKDNAFAKYYSSPQDPEPTNRNGYVPTHLVTVIQQVPPQPEAPMCDTHSFPPPSPAPSSIAASIDTDMPMEDLLSDLTGMQTDYEVTDMNIIDASSFIQNLPNFPNFTQS